MSELWKEAKDPRGRSYYWNVKTKETTWTPPPELIAAQAKARGVAAPGNSTNSQSTPVRNVDGKAASQEDSSGKGGAGAKQASKPAAGASSAAGSKNPTTGKSGPMPQNARTAAGEASAVAKPKAAGSLLASNGAVDAPANLNVKPLYVGPQTDPAKMVAAMEAAAKKTFSQQSKRDRSPMKQSPQAPEFKRRRVEVSPARGPSPLTAREALSLPDAIMDPDAFNLVIQYTQEKAQESGEKGPQATRKAVREALRLLSDNFHNSWDVFEKLFNVRRWVLERIKRRTEESNVREQFQGNAESTIKKRLKEEAKRQAEKQTTGDAMAHIKDMIIGNFDEEKAAALLDLRKEPKWIRKMLQKKDWRDVFVRLARDYPNNLFLFPFVTQMAAEGFHNEFTDLRSAAHFFNICARMMKESVDRICGPLDHESDEKMHLNNRGLREEEAAKFCKLAYQSDMAFAFAAGYLNRLLDASTRQQGGTSPQQAFVASSELSLRINALLEKLHCWGTHASPVTKEFGPEHLNLARSLAYWSARKNFRYSSTSHTDPSDEASIIQALSLMRVVRASYDDNTFAQRRDYERLKRQGNGPQNSEELKIAIEEKQKSPVVPPRVRQPLSEIFKQPSVQTYLIHVLRDASLINAVLRDLFNPFSQLGDTDRRLLVDVAVSITSVGTNADRVLRARKLTKASQLLNKSDSLNVKYWPIPKHKYSSTDGLLRVIMLGSKWDAEKDASDKMPVVAQGILHWLEAALTSHMNVETATYEKYAHNYIALLDPIIEGFPIQHERVLKIIFDALHVEVDMTSDRRVQIHAAMVDRLVSIIEKGDPIPVLHIFGKLTRLNINLCRNFIVELFRLCQPPFSQSFAVTLCNLLAKVFMRRAIMGLKPEGGAAKAIAELLVSASAYVPKEQISLIQRQLQRIRR